MAAIVLLFAGVVAVGVWYAATTDEDVVQDDFGDASISEVALEVSNLGYEDGLRLLAGGEVAKGRAVMQRLAPLNLASKTAQGNAKAHLWMAQDLLAGKAFGFLNVCPLEAAGGKRLASPVVLAKGDLTARCQRHLESAVALDPELVEATILLAEVMVAQNQRNEGIALIHQSITAQAEVDLSVYLANLLPYAGDDLGLEEASWHAFATLGREVTGRKRGDLGVRSDYILYALELKQSDLAESAIGKFERDFGDGDDGAELVTSLKVSQWYFRAIHLLDEEQFSASKACEYLLNAHALQPGRAELVASLRRLVALYPDVKEQVEQGLGEVSQQLEQQNPLAAASLLVFLAELNPAASSAHMKRAHALNSEDPSLVVAWVGFQLQEDAPKFSELEGAVLNLIESKKLSRAERYALLVALGEVRLAGERWYDALQALEQALAMSDSPSKGLHQMLGLAYGALGEEIIADEHKALAAQ